MGRWLQDGHVREKTAMVPNSDVLLMVEPELRLLLLEGDQQGLGLEVFQWMEQGLAMRFVRGRKMKTKQSLFDEFAAAFQFPLYFGENRDAFNDCMTDLPYLHPGKGYVVVITEPDEVLAGEDERRLRWLVDSLTDAVRGWAIPIERGEWEDDSPIVPFHVVLAGQHESLERAAQRWMAAGTRRGR